MHRFYLRPELCRGSTLTLTDREAHHALRVLRVQCDERVIVLDGAGGELLCEVASADHSALQLTVVSRTSVSPPSCQVTLLQSLPKGKIIESIIQKATELGVYRIVPILSERVVKHLDSGEAEHKTEKWQQVAIEAIKQCGTAWLPRIDAPIKPQQFIARKEKFELSLVGSLQAGTRHMRECLDELRLNRARLPKSACVWIGPEGDFSTAEMNTIRAAGALPVSFGPLVLRVETAALFCLSVLNYETQTAIT